MKELPKGRKAAQLVPKHKFLWTALNQVNNFFFFFFPVSFPFPALCSCVWSWSRQHVKCSALQPPQPCSHEPPASHMWGFGWGRWPSLQLCLRRCQWDVYYGEDWDPPVQVEVQDVCLLLKGDCCLSHSLMGMDRGLLWLPDYGLFLCKKWQRRVKAATPALCLPWEMFMGLQAGKVWGSVHSSAAALLKKPSQNCASFTLSRKPQAWIPPHAAIWEPQEKYVGVRRESARSPGGKENVMCNYWAVPGSEAQLSPPAGPRDSSGSAYCEKPAASLSSPSLPAALFQDGATVTYCCHRGSTGCATVAQGVKSPRCLFENHCVPRWAHLLFRKWLSWASRWLGGKASRKRIQKVQPWKRTKISENKEKQMYREG